jgi:hypothetical protein
LELVNAANFRRARNIEKEKSFWRVKSNASGSRLQSETCTSCESKSEMVHGHGQSVGANKRGKSL